MGATKKAVDFSSVPERGDFNPKRVDEGDYLAKITKAEDAEVKNGENKGTFQYLFTIKLAKFSQYSYPYYCQLDTKQLWKLRNLMVAAGKNVPKKRVPIDPNQIVGKSVGVTMEDNEYDKNGKTMYKSQIAAVFPAAELADGVEFVDQGTNDFDEGSDADTTVDIDYGEAEVNTDEKPKKKKKAKAKAESEPEPEAEPAKKKKKADKEVEELDITDM
jgi:hypothetical protein